MAAMRSGHRFDDRRGLAVPADADDETLVAPFHGRAPPSGAKMRRRGNARQLQGDEKRKPGKRADEGRLARPRAQVKTQPPTEPATLEPA